MNYEIIIRDWLMSWFRPEKTTDFNPIENARTRAPITSLNYDKFMNIFQDDGGRQELTDKEKNTVKGLITKPLQFSTGYPPNAEEAIQPGTVYIIEGGWRQLNTYPGANFWHGKKATQIAVVGSTKGKSLNHAEPSILLKIITSLLIAGHHHFIAHHMDDPVITETLYSQDEQNSNEKGFAIRTLMIEYAAERHGVITQYGANKDG